MTEGNRIAEQLRRMMFGAAWHGPSVLEALDGVTAKAAAAHPIPGAHSVWELIAHIDVTQKHILTRLRGEASNLTDADFFPSVGDTSEKALKDAVARLKAQEEEIIGAASRMNDEQIAAVVPGGATAYETFHGHCQHNAFHAGQIRLLRKLAGASV
jgi:uncharacterized damage-inducible protein DinB